MPKPTFDDYVKIIFHLFDQFEQEQRERHRGRPVIYKDKILIVFFIIMQFKRLYKFKAQQRWLENHPDQRAEIGLATVPHRTTLSRRYKALYQVIQEFVAFLGELGVEFDLAFASQHLYEDKSLFKALGPVWHQSDRQAGRVPTGLRNLDQEATWSKSGYHGWVYGYGLHITCNLAAFPLLVQVETGAVAEKTVIDQKEAHIIETIEPATLSGDNSYAQATRIRRWAKKGVALLSPAFKWKNSRYAQAYHRFIKAPVQAELLKKRRTTVEPLFDLIAKAIGTIAQQKQLPLQGLKNVRTCLALGTLTVQIAMLVNSLWALPLRNISNMHAVFS
jgi:hypothetical protein